MFNTPEENDADRGLRQGLRALPTPEISADFDARIHAALRQPTPWYRALWTTARPVLSATACSLVVTLALLQWSARTPGKPVRQTGSAIASAPGADRLNALDQNLEHMDLSNASFRSLSAFPHPFHSSSPLEAGGAQPNTTPAPHPPHNAPNHRSQFNRPQPPKETLSWTHRNVTAPGSPDYPSASSWRC